MSISQNGKTEVPNVISFEDPTETETAFSQRMASANNPDSWVALTGPMTPEEVKVALDKLIEVARRT